MVLVCCGGIISWKAGGTALETPLTESVYVGNASAKDKVAIIRLNGVIMEGALGYVHKQIEQAAKDEHVKAVVLRINSPGGSITASDDLYRRLIELRDGNKEKKCNPKTLVVSMGALAASGGYYSAMPGQIIYAEKTTMTGSIGVYISFPNIAGFADHHKFSMKTIKAGNIKDSGSAFKVMTPEEEQVWKDMIDEAYDQFLDVVADGRKNQSLTKDDLLKKFTCQPIKVGDEGKDAKPYQRYLADGGIWTAEAARKYKLIDKIGTLEDALKDAHDRANMSGDYKTVEYERPRSVLDLLSVKSGSPAAINSPLLDPARLSNAMTPRIWLLAPGSEAAGLMAAVDAE
jgi:protease-4